MAVKQKLEVVSVVVLKNLLISSCNIFVFVI